MRCPKCGFDDTRVVDSRTQEATNAIKRRRECRLDVLSGDEDKGLMESVDVGPAQLKAQQVVDDELVERHEEKRPAAQRSAIEHLSLLMAESIFDHIDDEFRI